MSTEQKHQRIREALASIGYHVRAFDGKPLTIVRNSDIAIAEALAPKYRFRIHNDYAWYIVKAA